PHEPAARVSRRDQVRADRCVRPWLPPARYFRSHGSWVLAPGATLVGNQPHFKGRISCNYRSAASISLRSVTRWTTRITRIAGDDKGLGGSARVRSRVTRRDATGAVSTASGGPL